MPKQVKTKAKSQYISNKTKPLSALSFATVKNGEINWVAQPSFGKRLGTKMKSFAKTFGEKAIRVCIQEIENGNK